MSLFGSKKKTETVADAPTSSAKATEVKKAKVVKAVKVVNAAKVAKPATKAVAVAVPADASVSISNNLAGAILRPRITEKSGLLSQGGVYTFEIAKNANKNSVAQAVKALYKVIPTRVAILNNPAKNVFVRGRRGVVPGVRKAVVTLKKGDKIDFV